MTRRIAQLSISCLNRWYQCEAIGSHTSGDKLKLRLDVGETSH